MTHQHHLGSTVVVDVGGTKTMAALAAALGSTAPAVLRTPADHDSFVAAVAGLVRDAHERPEYIVVATPDPVDECSVGGGMANLSVDAPSLARALEKEFGASVSLVGDAEAAAIAEFGLGAAAEAGVDDGIYLTVSTGVGASMVLDGRLRVHPGVGELGHIPVPAAGGIHCGCGGVGCIETISSGTAVAVRATASAAESPVLSAIVRSRSITAHDVARAAAEGDPVARRVMDEGVAALASVVAHAVRTLAPEVIVLGGGYAIGTGLCGALERAVANLLVGSTVPTRTRFATARFGRASVLVGAALVAGDADWRNRTVRELAATPRGFALTERLGKQ